MYVGPPPPPLGDLPLPNIGGQEGLPDPVSAIGARTIEELAAYIAAGGSFSEADLERMRAAVESQLKDEGEAKANALAKGQEADVEVTQIDQQAEPLQAESQKNMASIQELDDAAESITHREREVDRAAHDVDRAALANAESVQTINFAEEFRVNKFNRLLLNESGQIRNVDPATDLRTLERKAKDMFIICGDGVLKPTTEEGVKKLPRIGSVIEWDDNGIRRTMVVRRHLPAMTAEEFREFQRELASFVRRYQAMNLFKPSEEDERDEKKRLHQTHPINLRIWDFRPERPHGKIPSINPPSQKFLIYVVALVSKDPKRLERLRNKHFEEEKLKNKIHRERDEKVEDIKSDSKKADNLGEQRGTENTKNVDLRKKIIENEQGKDIPPESDQD